MEDNQGYFKLQRSILNHRYLFDAEKFRFWVWCLLKATHKPHKILIGNETIQLEAGQFIIGRKKGAEALKVSERRFRTLLKFFSATERKVAIKTTNKYTLLTINDYNTYNNCNFINDQQNDQQVTSKRPASDQQVTTYNNDNNDNNDKNITLTFDAIWKKYPKRIGRKAAEKHYKVSVKGEQDYFDILQALENYLKSETVKKGFVQNGSTWFNNWRDWIDYREPQPETIEEQAVRLRKEMGEIL